MSPEFVKYATHYAAWLGTSAALLGAFYMLYTRVTPWNEIALIREGNLGAAFSLSGALAGFSLTLASSIRNNDTLAASMAWGAGAMAVQLLAYAITVRMVGPKNGIPEGNVAAGLFMGAVSLAVGTINAACLT